MKRFLSIFALFFISAIHVAKSADLTPTTDFKCHHRTAKLQIKKGSNNLLFSTTGITTATTAQYYMTFCITTISTSGQKGVLSLVLAPYILKDIAQGGGDHVKAWLHQTGIPPNKQHQTIMELRKHFHFLTNQKPLQFAQQVHQIAYDFNAIPLHQRLIIKDIKQSNFSSENN
ncbi:MAG: hypothetical protein HQM14_04845 [SAR324 cluster bacterium]|nr:hypothetical protein [SAR324 cluster bacterium]